MSSAGKEKQIERFVAQRNYKGGEQVKLPGEPNLKASKDVPEIERQAATLATIWSRSKKAEAEMTKTKERAAATLSNQQLKRQERKEKSRTAHLPRQEPRQGHGDGRRHRS